jgi:hypothetical protein
MQYNIYPELMTLAIIECKINIYNQYKRLPFLQTKIQKWPFIHS